MAYTVVDKGSKYFNTVLYTGTGATRSITGAGFKPDWVWIKERSASASAHNLSDAVRGAGKALFSNTTDAEYDYGTGTGGNLRSFDSDGFSLGTATQTNDNGTTFVSWNWLGANTTVSNTSGTITSTVSANTTSGFSVVSYTGTGANATVGHGLGAIPKLIIGKRRNLSEYWVVQHGSLGSGQVGYLQSTDAFSSTGTWNNTNPTSSTFGIGTTNNINASGSTYIAYCFAEVKGYSKFGSYTGNGSTDGTFVYLGFKPAFVMTKASSTTGNWKISWNSFTNGNDFNLAPNLTNAEGSANQIDLLSNGFKCRVPDTDRNGNGTTYIYAAFAENPFVSSKGLPCTAR
jgi:hypothetical protein